MRWIYTGMYVCYHKLMKAVTCRRRGREKMPRYNQTCEPCAISEDIKDGEEKEGRC